MPGRPGPPPSPVRFLAGAKILASGCLDGQDAIAKRRIEEALGDPGKDGTAEAPGEDDDG